MNNAFIGSEQTTFNTIEGGFKFLGSIYDL
jgi:hypothetical protein